MVITHEADLEDILEMDFHGLKPEVVIKGKIPVMNSEHCLFAPSSACSGKTDSSERSESEAEGRCLVGDLSCCTCKEEDKFYLKDRKSQFYLIIVNPKTCQNII